MRVSRPTKERTLFNDFRQGIGKGTTAYISLEIWGNSVDYAFLKLFLFFYVLRSFITANMTHLSIPP